MVVLVCQVPAGCRIRCTDTEKCFLIHSWFLFSLMRQARDRLNRLAGARQFQLLAEWSRKPLLCLISSRSRAGSPYRDDDETVHVCPTGQNPRQRSPSAYKAGLHQAINVASRPPRPHELPLAQVVTSSGHGAVPSSWPKKKQINRCCETR